MLCKMISVIWFPWWGWTERLDFVNAEEGCIYWFSKHSFCFQNLYNGQSWSASSLFHHLAWCSPSSNMKISTLHFFSQLHGSLREVGRHTGPSLFLNPKVWISNLGTAPRNYQEVTFALCLSCWKGAGGTGSRFGEDRSQRSWKRWPNEHRVSARKIPNNTVSFGKKRGYWQHAGERYFLLGKEGVKSWVFDKMQRCL